MSKIIEIAIACAMINEMAGCDEMGVYDMKPVTLDDPPTDPTAVALTNQTLEDLLPHGSGINYDWWFMDKRNCIHAYNSFDVMDEWGGYTGVIDFHVSILKTDPKVFKLVIHGKRSHYLSKRYCIREYLDDTFAEDFDTNCEKYKQALINYCKWV